jgi:hypothetical protein
VLIASVGGADSLESYAVPAFLPVYIHVEFSWIANDVDFLVYENPHIKV